MSSRDITRKLRTQLRQGEPMTEQAVDDYVMMDAIDRSMVGGPRPNMSMAQGVRLGVLMQSEDSGWLTFLAQEGALRVKIGFTRDPDRRVSQLQSYSAVPVRILAMVRAPSDYAKALHTALKDHHSHGEWFELDADVAALIADLSKRKFRAIHEFVHKQGVYRPQLVG